MHVGVKIPNWGPLAGPDALVATAVAADQSNFDSVWVSDHVAMPRSPLTDYPYAASSTPPLDPTTPFLESFVALAHVAAVTERVQLGTGVLVLPLRQPVLVAKQAASLDVLSRGRLVLGVGAGWLADEFALLGQPFDDRGGRTDEGIDILRRCWAQQDLLVDGRPTPVAMMPSPVRHTRLPVLVGGHSRAALRRAALVGDGWYGSNLSAERFSDLVRALRPFPGGDALRVGARPGVVAAEEAGSTVGAFRDAGADFVVLDAPYAAMDVAAARTWVHRVADALDLDGSAQPLVARPAAAPASDG